MAVSLAWEGDWPISQGFGENPPMYLPDFPGHEGLDIAIPTGVHVRALWSGDVVEVGLGGTFYGYYVKLWAHETMQELLYCHLSPYHLPAPGDVVDAGARLAITGASGRIFGVHLHIGYRRDRFKRDGRWRGFSDPVPVLAIEPPASP